MAAEIPDGAVLVARAMLNSSLWTMRAEDRVVAMTCICLCNWKPRRWFDGHKEITIARGQFVRSLGGLAEAARVTRKVLRTSLQHLENTGFLARTRAQRYTLYTIPKYDHYQDLTKYSDSANAENGHKIGHATGTQRARNGHRAGTKQECLEEREKGKKGRPAATATPAPAAPPAAPTPMSHSRIVAKWLADIKGMTPRQAASTLAVAGSLVAPYPEVEKALREKAEAPS